MRTHRGQTCVFEKNLLTQAGQPLDPAARVDVRVTDPTDRIVSQGPAAKNLDTENYEFRFIVPLDAQYSTLDRSWSVDWAYRVADGQVIDVIVDFDVVALDERLPEQTIVAQEKSTEWLDFWVPEKASNLELEVLRPNGQRVGFQKYNPQLPISDTNNPEILKLTEVDDFEATPVENGYIYTIRFDTTEIGIGDYMLRLTAKLPSRKRPHTEISILRVVPNNFWFLYPSLQMFLDKARKRHDLVIAYTKSDMYEYLCRGAAMLNISPPQVTSWQLENFPMGGNFYGTIDFSHFLISAAALWALQAQNLAYGELNFQFTGQTVTLGYDATSAIAAELDQLLNVVNEQFPRAKELALRQMQRGVIVGVRRQFWNQGLSRVDTLRRALDVHLNYLNMPMNTMRYPM